MIERVGNACCGCAACANVCPKQCIAMEANEEGFLYPKVREDACVHCGACEKVCPVLHPEPAGTDLNEVWAASATDPEILRQSSSGGLFSLLAQACLDAGGCVFGAAFAPDMRTVRHTMAETPDELAALRGSKYMQSEIGDCYTKVREQLKSGRQVLFAGTPCQVAGLRRFLGRDEDNLLLVDLICHGTPSALLWQKFLASVEKKTGGKAVAASFRHKKNGWQTFGTNIDFSNRPSYYQTFKTDPYMRVFLRNTCLRESCYRCAVKEAGLASDITIGDFWGVRKAAPEMNNEMGVSLALIHTEKGKARFGQILPALSAKEVDEESAMRENPLCRHSAARPKARDRMYKDLRTLDWARMEKKYAEVGLKAQIRKKLGKSVFGKLYRAVVLRSRA
ncbi:MAG: Coenzyme F420 hydrogenase/dehydrogenase, beta subunit C-terminal domain [Clostridia bacterium]|nr:Coenzyme F420 hydrogenase/dehydrogenase, beta subunit C-terminal domain [Clostridia bacterium]